MQVKDLADKCRRLKPITESTYKSWLKAIKPIRNLLVKNIDNDEALNYRMSLLKPWGPLAQGTLKCRLWSLQSIWNVAIRSKLISGSENPWEGQGKEYTKHSRRYPFIPFENYSRFHEDPLFLGYWYHGMRLGELAGLLPDEIHTDDEIPYFDLKHNSVRRLKNEASVRQVPIHKSFLPYAHLLKADKREQPGKVWSNKLKKHMGHGAHALRHSFITRMRRAGIEYSIAMSIVGHTPFGETAT